jgi:hypothetical protein
MTTLEAEALSVRGRRCAPPTWPARQIVTPRQVQCTGRLAADWQDRIARIPTDTVLAHPCNQTRSLGLRLAASRVPNGRLWLIYAETGYK